MGFNKGRHFAGTPLGAPVKPPSRTGSPSGKFIGTGVNRKTKAAAAHTSSGSLPAQNYTRQAEQYTKQSPEPFRNPQPSVAAMNTLPPKDSGEPQSAAGGGGYTGFKGNRISIKQGIQTSSGKSTNYAAAGIMGTRGRGSELGKVAGPKQPRKIGPPQFPSGSKRPSFYGR